MITLEELRARLTITVPEAGEILGLGKDASYAAVARGEIPNLKLGRRIVVPVPRLLELLGAYDQGVGAPVFPESRLRPDSPSEGDNI